MNKKFTRTFAAVLAIATLSSTAIADDFSADGGFGRDFSSMAQAKSDAAIKSGQIGRKEQVSQNREKPETMTNEQKAAIASKRGTTIPEKPESVTEEKKEELTSLAEIAAEKATLSAQASLADKVANKPAPQKGSRQDFKLTVPSI